MPITRKLTTVGASRGVTLPASWLALIEKETGSPVKEILMEVNESIVIKPVTPKKGGI